MPIHDYHCPSCDHQFEMLVRSNDTPSCPKCGSQALERMVSRIAPHGTSKAIIASARQAAGKEGHFSHYSKAERAKLR